MNKKQQCTQQNSRIFMTIIIKVVVFELFEELRLVNHVICMTEKIYRNSEVLTIEAIN